MEKREVSEKRDCQVLQELKDRREMLENLVGQASVHQNLQREKMDEQLLMELMVDQADQDLKVFRDFLETLERQG